MPNLFTIEDVAQYLQTDEAFIKKLIRNKQISAVKYGHFVRVPGEAVKEFVTRNYVRREADLNPKAKKPRQKRKDSVAQEVGPVASTVTIQPAPVVEPPMPPPAPKVSLADELGDLGKLVS